MLSLSYSSSLHNTSYLYLVMGRIILLASIILVVERIRARRNEPFLAHKIQVSSVSVMAHTGARWWNWHFWGEESGPLLRQSRLHRFPSCSYEQHKKKKKKDSCHHWKTNWAVGIKVRDRDYILLQKRNRRGWLESKDSMIGWLVRALFCMIGLTLSAW